MTDLIHLDKVSQDLTDLCNDISKTKSYQTTNQLYRLIELVADLFDSDDQEEALSALESWCR